jgi:hypothetical protein
VASLHSLVGVRVVQDCMHGGAAVALCAVGVLSGSALLSLPRVTPYNPTIPPSCRTTTAKGLALTHITLPAEISPESEWEGWRGRGGVDREGYVRRPRSHQPDGCCALTPAASPTLPRPWSEGEGFWRVCSASAVFDEGDRVLVPEVNPATLRPRHVRVVA